MFTERVSAFDIETTGVDVGVDQAFQIGVQHYDLGSEAEAVSHLLLPTCEMTEGAAKVHGYTMDKLAGRPRFADVAHVIAADLGPGPFIVYNGDQLDVPMLRRQLQEVGCDWQPKVLDVYGFVCWYLRTLPAGERQLKAICQQRYGIDLPDAHNALADARATGQVLKALQSAWIIPSDLTLALAQSPLLSRVAAGGE